LFGGLDRYKRYARVLGHELTHASYALGDANMARSLDKLKKETAAFYAQRRPNSNGTS
jgi:hypothetical protein